MSFPAVSESPAQERKSWAGLRKEPSLTYLLICRPGPLLPSWSLEGLAAGLTCLMPGIIALIVAVGFSVGDFIGDEEI